MPVKTMWLLRVPEIRQEVAALTVPVVDRAIFEKVFHVRRRRAIDIMHAFGGFEVGQVLLIDRAELLRQLQALEGGAEFAIEQRRRQRLVESLEKLRRQRTAAAARIPVAPPDGECSVANLPAGISLQAGSLRIDFHGAEDLLRKLFELARAVSNDFEAFHTVVERPALKRPA